MSIADSEPVKKVRKALQDAGLDDTVIELDEPLETSAQAAGALATEPGAVVSGKVFAIGTRMVLVLTAGDHAPIEANLGPAAFIEGDVREATDAEVRGLTGFSAACVPPAGWKHPIPVLIDRSLKRFETLYAMAGDPQCAFKISIDGLKRLTGGTVSWNVARPLEGEVETPPMARNKSFTGDREVPGLDVSGLDVSGSGGGD